MRKFIRRAREAGCLIISGLCSAAGIGGIMALVLLFSGTAQANVYYSDDGTNVVMSNSLARVKILKSECRVTEFNLGDSPNLLRYVSGGRKGMYFHCSMDGVVNGVTNSFDDVKMFQNTSSPITVASNVSPNKCWVRFKQAKMGPDPTEPGGASYTNGLFDFELNFVMRDNEPGFYSYLVVRHKSGQEAARLVYPRHMVAGADFFCSDSNDMEYVTANIEYSTTNRTGQTIGWDYRSEEHLLGEDEADACYWVPEDGYYSCDELGATGAAHEADRIPVWTKYDWGYYQGDTTEANPVFGVVAMTNDTKGYGLWLAFGSREFFNGGPTKMKAGAQGSNLVIDYSEAHASAGELHDANFGKNEVLTKIFGPVYVFANTTNTTTDAMWTSAQAIANQKVTDWPYTWVNESSSVYPTSRGTVTGSLGISGASAANATIVLASPTTNTTINTNISPWRAQGVRDYLFWTTTDVNGDFSIPKVRAGTYNLYAFAPGHFGELKLTDITVTAGSTTDVGDINWTPEHYETVCWTLGTPDRSAGEFKWGNCKKQFGLWWDYLNVDGTGSGPGTNKLIYTVGESGEGSDWYYAQMISALPSNSFGGAVLNNHYTDPEWNIKFTLTNGIPSNPVLTVALAGAQEGRLKVTVNGKKINGGGTDLTDDSSVKRSAITSGWYQLYRLPITTGLVSGSGTTNTITFTLPYGPSGENLWYGSTNPMPQLPPRAILYDCVQLSGGTFYPDSYTID